MFENLLQWDKKSFIWFFTEVRNAGWVPFMEFISNKFTWVPLYLYLIFYFIYKFKAKSTIWLLSLILLAGTSDFTGNILKKKIGRDRPCRNTATKELLAMTYQQENREFHCSEKGGSFPSNHAFNHFALSFFLFMFFYKKNRWIAWSFILWAMLISVSRVYLGLHFPLDVLAGSLMGILVGWIFYKLAKYFSTKGTKFFTKNTKGKYYFVFFVYFTLCPLC